MKLPAFVFSNKWMWRLARHAAFWFAIIIFVQFAQISRQATTDLRNDLENFTYLLKFVALITLLVAVPFCYIVIYVLTPRYLLKKKYFLFILTILFTIIFFDAVSDLILYSFLNLANAPKSDLYLTIWNFTIEFLSDGGISSCALLLCLKLFKTWYLKQAEGQMLMKANAEAEMQILKAQVQPHFLFNTLNNIYSFILNKSPKAKELVSNLYEIMKYMVNDCNVELIELSKDLKMIQDYVQLEKVRYGRRLDIKINIDGEYQNKMITPLLMIPFVENSFKHGASKMLKSPWINLSIQADESMLHFTLANSKPANEILKNKYGVGLNNVKKRLELLYPQNHLLLIESTENTYTVNMQIPLHAIDQEVVA